MTDVGKKELRVTEGERENDNRTSKICGGQKEKRGRREEAREIGIVGAGAATTRKFCAQIL